MVVDEGGALVQVLSCISWRTQWASIPWKGGSLSSFGGSLSSLVGILYLCSAFLSAEVSLEKVHEMGD